jgi:hypothetical protein
MAKERLFWALGFIAVPLTAWISKWGLAIAVVPFCDSWNEGDGIARECSIFGIEGLASDGFGILNISSFTLGFPLMFLAALSFLCTVYWVVLVKKKVNLTITLLGAGGALLGALATLIFILPIIMAVGYILSDINNN